MSIGENIKKIRLAKFISQKDLSDKICISRSYLADIENNRYNPSIKTLNKIAKALNVKISDILEEETLERETKIPEPLFTYEERNILECLVLSKIQSLKESIAHWNQDNRTDLTETQAKIIEVLQKDLEKHNTLLEKLKSMEVK
ncbi:transcriptional regulator, XRE family [Thermoanaerobacterium phage THSA-485A]|uniref:transcriptional regulator, XRE family n=1 Tax=Thermoanaerobacterium phage THSA-485A TaxID=1126885 RepID=UPI000263F8E8|nr:transcriptional regulator, XRE family [Thermoanaerobacterium phage THSA-485A]AFK87733.1 transcriptional regulator, XRE family [Thermoanaerobacterium phage THSA-485A]